jgi:hypothetical protein
MLLAILLLFVLLTAALLLLLLLHYRHLPGTPLMVPADSLSTCKTTSQLAKHTGGSLPLHGRHWGHE